MLVRVFGLRLGRAWAGVAPALAFRANTPAVDWLTNVATVSSVGPLSRSFHAAFNLAQAGDGAVGPSLLASEKALTTQSPTLEEEKMTSWRKARALKLKKPPPRPHEPFSSDLNFVDKTAFYARILTPDKARGLNQSLFILSPPRLGKTTSLVQMQFILLGERELFDGYEVNRPDSAFDIQPNRYSVISLTFSGTDDCADENAVRAKLLSKMRAAALDQHGIVIPETEPDLGSALQSWIMQLETNVGLPIVVLLDEYDYPILRFLTNPAMAEKVSVVLAPFFSVLKEFSTAYLKPRESTAAAFAAYGPTVPLVHKAVVTGITKFGYFSLSGPANNFVTLKDTYVDFAGLHGITRQELKDTYGEWIEANVVDAPGSKWSSLDAVVDHLTKAFNGYRCHPEQVEADTTLIPVSVLDFFINHLSEVSSDIWSRAAIRGTVVHAVGVHTQEILNGCSCTWEMLTGLFYPAKTPWQQLAFHMGVATIKSKSAVNGKLHVVLGSPNKEVTTLLRDVFPDVLARTPTLSACLEEIAPLLVGAHDDSDKYRTVSKIITSSAKSVASVEERQDWPRNESELQSFMVAIFQVKAERLFSQVRVQIEHPVDAKEAELVSKFKRSDVLLVYPLPSDRSLFGLLVVELKFSSGGRGGRTGATAAANQIVDKEYVERAMNYFKSKDGITVLPENVRAIGLHYDSSSLEATVVVVKDAGTASLTPEARAKAAAKAEARRAKAAAKAVAVKAAAKAEANLKAAAKPPQAVEPEE